MNFSNKIPIALIGTIATIVIAQPTAVFAISADEVGKIAKSITVLIDSKNPGSGIIIKRNGNTYTVLTARHVFKDAQAKYEIVTPDNKRYLLNYSSVKKLPNIDLAVVEFTSTQTYSVAKIGNSDLATEGKAAYVAGFPKTSAAINTSIYNFTDGRITANASRPLEDGYALVYSNNTLPGMSGGPVLNENGEVVGIHGRADTRAAESNNINQNILIAKTGFNLGIPINTSLRLLASSQVDLGVKVPSVPVATGPKADDFYIQGVNRFYEGDFQGAIAAYDRAIGLNPNYAAAYVNRAETRLTFSRDTKRAREDLNQALRISPNNVEALLIRGIDRKGLGDNQGATNDLNQVVRQSNPISATDYTNRGRARLALEDVRGAIEDFNQALKIAPNTPLTYLLRGKAYERLGDDKSAIADYDQALRINPNFLLGYNNRGGARFRSRDYQGAIADYDQVLRINPNYASGYGDRGVVRYELGDYQGAIADHNQALKINPNDAGIYFWRGTARDKLGDKQGTLNDYQKSAELYQQEGNIKSYEQVIRRIRKLQESTAPNQSTSTTLLAINSSLIPGKSSALPSDGSLYELHTFEGRAGQSVTISVESR
ncbi:tetratricopeptide repeat-containing serine protease family protein, partial [Microcoleus anatoxicus]|uniref:tetratricopeptide repeat-containing serine protease family protein n=1 Tax=Microcoleus anatoxicus TaxID=2705319 RepID=UPI0030C9E9EC